MQAESSRLKRVVAIALRLAVVLTVVVLVSAGLGYRWFSANILEGLPDDLTHYRDWVPLTNVTVHDSDGQLIDTFHVERREWVALDTLPDHVWQAFVAAEDRRFFQHPGVDALGITRALATNLISGETRSGASTLTQQLVKNLLVGSERSYKRKLREAVLAWRLERSLGKQRILELYINYVALGSGNYGVQAAANDYFGLPASELDVGQAALIAGLVPAPSAYSPRVWPEVSVQRRNLVLGRMIRAGYLTPDEAAAFYERPVIVPQRIAMQADINAAYLTETRREIRRSFGLEFPFQAGLTVDTALRQDLQRVTVRAAQDATDAHVQRQGIRWSPKPGATPSTSSEPCFLARATVTRRDVQMQAADAVFTLQEPGPMVHTDEGPRPFRSGLATGQVFQVCRTDVAEIVAVPVHPWAQAAIVVVHTATGEVVASAGGREVPLEGFDRVTQARRQPGSSFKPFVYAAAMDAGRMQTDIMSDLPLNLPGGNGKTWSPRNYGGGFAGPMTLRSALARSTNTIAIRLALDVGIGRVVRLAKALGVRTPLREDPTVALGSSEVTPLDMAVAYTGLVRGGVPTDPVWIRSVQTVDNGPSARAGEDLHVGTESIRLAGGLKPRVISSAAAHQVVDMMRAVVTSGTARRAYVPGLDRGGKTGTTNDFVDAWFVGFTANHVIAVWVGTDGVASLGASETGGRAALPAWMAVADALDEPMGATVPLPADIAMVRRPEGQVALPWSSLAGKGPLPPTP